MNFNSTTHEYNKDGIEYISVTQFLNRFEKEFPKELIAQKTAKRDGTEASEVIRMWDLNGDISREYGNSIHKGIEYWVDFNDFSKLDHIKKATKDFAKKYDRLTLKSEQNISDKDLKLAGTIDLIQKLGNKKVNIIDIKTNYELDDKSKGYFSPPIDELPCSKINKYRLQLSLYKHLLELKGLQVEKIWIEHWDGKKFNTIPLEPIENETINKLLNYGK